MLGICFATVFIAVVYSYEPMENPNLFEGDMILDPDQLNEIKNGKINRDVPMAATKTNLWPRTIPIDYHELKWHGNGRHAIREAIKAFEKHTCLRFIERTTQKGYLKFYKGTGCYTYVGYNGREKKISLGKGCWTPEIAIHEMMHTLGFYHEQSRPDRDQFIKIHYENLLDGAKSQFQKRGTDVIDSLGVPYDYLSVMHYRKTAFSKNRKITIETLDKSMQDRIGQSRGLSQSDILQINRLYRCNETIATTVTPLTPDPSCTDTYDRCSRYKDKCSYPKDSAWYKWVAKECKRTCALCNGKK